MNKIINDKFCVTVTAGRFDAEWPNYFEHFWDACMQAAVKNNWQPIAVANYELKPMGGRLIQTSTQGWYLRWNKESSHTLFVLKWS
jgi:hypothetical protein